MPLSDEDKQRILEEERAREEARRQVQAERRASLPPAKASLSDKVGGCFIGAAMLFAVLALAAFLIFAVWFFWAANSRR